VLARQLAAEGGVSVRTVNRWLSQFKAAGYAGLVRRTRSEAGRPKIYSGEQWSALIGAAGCVRPGQMRATFRALSLPGSYENFRWWIWRVRRGEARVVEAKKIA